MLAGRSPGRFPRPRGDGPPLPLPYWACIWVSPPTRGWTPRAPWPRPCGCGFPAHAGMDPTRRPWVCMYEPGVGFPAHAGMDAMPRGFPAHAGGKRGRAVPAARRFPRPRGDGPTERRTILPMSPVSPPTRGWTRAAGVRRIAIQGFPAHAGMDPATASGPTPAPWFPRPRGDGPYYLQHDGTLPMVSPPTRGWTRQDQRGRRRLRGFPAHAGMDPSA